MEEQLILSIKNDYLNNISATRIAKKYGATLYKVNKIIKELGIKKDYSLEKFLIKKFLKSHQNYPAEIMMAKRITAKYPEVDFWEKVELGFQLNSLAYFLTSDGEQVIRKKYAGFKFDVTQPVSYNIHSQKIGEDVKIDYRPKTLKDFLK